MDSIIKQDLPIKNANRYGNFIRVELYYSKGGYNCFTSAEEKRGYYISAQPVSIAGGMISYTAFTGRKLCIKEVARKSAKAEAEAIAIFNAGEEREAVIEYVTKHNNYELEWGAE